MFGDSLQEVGPGVFANIVETGANLGVIVTKEGPVLVDTPLVPAEARKWREIVAGLNNKPVRFVINTDHHKAHCLGNQHFDAPVIAHEYAWKEMTGFSDSFRQRVADSFRRRNPRAYRELRELQIIPPTITVGDRLNLYIGDRVIRLIHVGGHTPATTLVHVPDAKVVFTGDCFVNGYHPYMAQADTEAWLDALQTVRRLEADVIVPGHGPLATAEDTQILSDYIRLARRKVRAHLLAGRSKSETTNLLVDEVMPLYSKPTGRRDRLQSKIRTGLGRIYDDLKAGMARGKPNENPWK
ncbi:MAG: MBL fold metallo-hydrolase [Anaerolineae bacterium]